MLRGLAATRRALRGPSRVNTSTLSSVTAFSTHWPSFRRTNSGFGAGGRRHAHHRWLCTDASHGSDKPVYVTTPIFYANSKPHIGHVYTATLADAYARWHRMKDKQVHFLTGTDEHGSKVQEAAERAEQSPLEFCDAVSKEYQQVFAKAQISYDAFHRTTSTQHRDTVEAVWRALKEKGYIYMGSHEGWYCKADEAFVPEVQLTKKEDGTFCTEAGHAVEWVSEPNYKFKLSAFREPLLKWLAENPGVIQPAHEQAGVIASLEASELDDLSVSRVRDRVEWAIPVPDDAEHSVYVWLDALTIYLSGAHGMTGEVTHSSTAPRGSVVPERLLSPPLWPADLQILGKDIVRFHAVYWPAFLLALDLPLPRKLVSHAHWMCENRKMSKSIGNVVDPGAMMESYGADSFRYFLLKEGNLEWDSNFSEDMLRETCNADLADALGNMLSRCVAKSMLTFESDIPFPRLGPKTTEDEQLLAKVEECTSTVEQCYDDMQFSAALRHCHSLILALNNYFHHEEPWVKRKKDPERHETIMHVSLESLRVIGIMLRPAMPQSMDTLLDKLKVPNDQRQWRHARVGRPDLDTVQLEPVKVVLFTKT